jgi:hypothetical protein
MRTPVRSLRYALLVASMMALSGGRALARQILQTANDSLTTYVPSGKWSSKAVRNVYHVGPGQPCR